jgi:hypothetical protein
VGGGGGGLWRAGRRQYRVQVGDAIGVDWDEQHAWVTRMGPDNPKNYQIWVYRKACVTRTNKPERELDFVAQMLRVSESPTPSPRTCVLPVSAAGSVQHAALSAGWSWGWVS